MQDIEIAYFKQFFIFFKIFFQKLGQKRTVMTTQSTLRMKNVWKNWVSLYF